MGVTPLKANELSLELERTPGWILKDGKLHREFRFADFSEAFSFMTRAALVCEQLNHHPEWSNVYNRLVVNLSTHECGGISTRDFEWARAVNKFLR